MARFRQFLVALEYLNEDFISLTELQHNFQQALENEDYKEADKLRKLIDSRIENGDEDEDEEYKEIDDICFIDLDEVAAFYKSQFSDGKEYTNVILKNGNQLPILIDVMDFFKLI